MKYKGEYKEKRTRRQKRINNLAIVKSSHSIIPLYKSGSTSPKDKDTTNKKLQANIPDKHSCKILNQTILNSTKGSHTMTKWGFTSGI